MSDTSETKSTTDSTESKTEQKAATETKSEASAETKKEVDTALSWDQPKDAPPQDRKDTDTDIGGSTKMDDNIDARYKADAAAFEAKQKETQAGWDDFNAKMKERDATDAKWEAEHADSKEGRDYHAGRAADAQGDAADYRKEAAEHKAERADLQAEAAGIRSDVTQDRVESDSLKETADTREKDADAWRDEARKQRDEAADKHIEASEIRTWGTEEVAREKGYEKPQDVKQD